MRKTISVLFCGLLAAIVLAAAACGGGDKGGDGVSSGGDLSGLLVSNPGKALGKSAEAFAANVQSMQGNFVFVMSGGGFQVDVSGDFSYRAPDQIYMTMNMAAAGDESLAVLGDMDFEILMLGGNLYMNTPFFGGWVVMTMEDIGVDAVQYEKLLEDHAPFDYSALIEGLDAVESLGEEEIAGHTYTHLRLETDFAEAMGAIADSFGTTGFDPRTVPFDALSGPLVFDLWVDPATGLPFRIQAVGTMEVPQGIDDTGAALGGPMKFDMRFDFDAYNVDVNIPAAPGDAKPFVDLFGGDGS